MGINRDEMKTLFDAAFGTDGAKLKDKGNVKIADFYSTDDEDPIAWLKEFERFAKRYKWTDGEQKVDIAGTYMKGNAAEWFDEKQVAQTHWKDNDGDNFCSQFIAQFANDTRKNNWYQELVTLK